MAYQLNANNGIPLIVLFEYQNNCNKGKKTSLFNLGYLATS